MKMFILLFAVLFLSACGSKLDGTYADRYSKLTFKSNGKVIQSAMGMEVESNYEVEGSKVKLITTQGTLLLTILEDGSIQNPMGGKLTKQKN